MKSILVLALIIILLVVLTSPAEAYQNQKIKGWGASFLWADMPEGWLPPLTYDFYLVYGAGCSSGDVPRSVLQYLKDNGKKIGASIYQDSSTHPWPEKGRIDYVFEKYGHLMDFVMVFEEIGLPYGTMTVQEANDSYDYIKSKYPWVKVYANPQVNSVDFTRLNEIKADGWILGARWWYSLEFEEIFLNPMLATGKPIINLLFLGAFAGEGDLWKYAIDQHRATRPYKIPELIVLPFYPGLEEITQERLGIIREVE